MADEGGGQGKVDVDTVVESKGDEEAEPKPKLSCSQYFSSVMHAMFLQKPFLSTMHIFLPPALYWQFTTRPDDDFNNALLFLFSLLQLHPALLLDHTSLVHASDHAVLVLQTNQTALPVPFYAGGGAPLSVSTRAPTPHALAGLASALGSLLAPFESFRLAAADEDDARGARRPLARDFHWAVGRHPFG